MVLDVQYVCGFVDGEGCFCHVQSARGPIWHFNVTQKTREVLDQIADTIGIPRYVYPHASGGYVLQTSSHKWVAKVKEFFRKNILFVKAEHFEWWASTHDEYLNRPRPRSRIGEEKIALIKKFRAEGNTIRATAEMVGVGVGTVQKWEKSQ